MKRLNVKADRPVCSAPGLVGDDTMETQFILIPRNYTSEFDPTLKEGEISNRKTYPMMENRTQNEIVAKILFTFP
jgi:hypothetical protein